jgi:uncharacterized damage-inducible protein DinB
VAADRYPTLELAQWVEDWQQTRALTYDLLRALPAAVLNFSPAAGFGPLSRQIRHVGDIQACYLAALQTGRMDFTSQPRQRKIEQSKEHLEGYLQALDASLLDALRGLGTEGAGRLIQWDGESLSLLRHLIRLIQHETLHHGMWAIYASVADLPLPTSWHAAWRLG